VSKAIIKKGNTVKISHKSLIKPKTLVSTLKSEVNISKRQVEGSAPDLGSSGSHAPQEQTSVMKILSQLHSSLLENRSEE